jgi:hypothetical protein
MKIGVFGDSFAEKDCNNNIWWKYLQTEYHHQVESFGECGSSILFSAQQINNLAKNYDLVIWALTTPGRFSLLNKDKTVHVVNGYDSDDLLDLYIQKQVSICQEYLVHVFDWEQENFVGQSIACYLQEKYKNIMILPCFPPPLSAQFNLYQLCEWEAKFYFPDKTIPEIYNQYQDLRAGHISNTNQKILAMLINQSLVPGIFQTDYTNFVKPTETFAECFSFLK